MIFLLLQKRIFGSYYWEHIVAELRSQAKLASQGAVLFNEISRKRIDEDRQHEDETVSKITRSLDRIKEQQSKLHRSGTKAATTLFESSEHFEGLLSKKTNIKIFDFFFVAIRSGDYYMFEYESDEEEDEGKQDESTAAQEQVKRDKINKDL
jgi:hypothetical protein